MNPALPLEHFVPDSEARHFSDGRTYVYGSYDVSGDTFYCSRDYHVFSSADLVSWTDHGVSFSTHDRPLDDPWRNATLFAPDCIYRDGAYYLYFCTAGNGEGVAHSRSPAGPFVDPVPVEGAHLDAIDPAAFVDDDGSAYLYWGQFDARGARLSDDGRSIVSETLNPSLLNEKEHGFHEGPSVRRRNGIYYLVYADISRGRPTALGYATATSPLGPFTRRGIIIDNAGCDPETWNNHGSIEEVDGRWYVFYHRSSQGSRFSRRLCIEPIFFDADGLIAEVEMTTGGVEGPLDPRRFMDASRACLLDGTVRAMPVHALVLPTAAVGEGPDAYKDQPGEPHEVLTRITRDDAACYRYFDFSGETTFACLASSATYGGDVELRLDDPDGDLIGTCRVAATGSWQRFERYECRVKGVRGVHGLWLRFRTGDGRSPGRLFDVRGFSFSR